MKKYCWKLLLILSVFIFTHPSYAQSTKIITLKDGSVLQGEVVELTDQVYTIKTSNLGQIQLKESDILSIISKENYVNAKKATEDRSLQSQQIKGQVQALQNNILSDPDIMRDIQSLIEDEEIKSIITDKNFINDIMSYDPQRIDKNEKTSDLMRNPKIQNLMNKINQKLPAQK